MQTCPGLRRLLCWSGFSLALGLLARPGSAADDIGLVCRPLPQGHFHFAGLVGERVRNNVDQWLLTAPIANPGMLEMFRLRDRQPSPELVPWAGEFVGKYLISAIQALRMNDRPELRTRVAQTIAELIATQAEDGYLGPFRQEVRLKGNWDLWGHYHCLLALLMWHEATGEIEPLQACRRAADLVCTTFLDSNLRVFDAGSHEMNMAIVHGLGRLYRLTHEPRYWQMMRAIEKDWERAGDYLRAGLAGVEFFQSPRPRWESLHDLQGLVEYYRISGDDQYRAAFAHHWRSIWRWDRRNTGGFSSGEQATGNPFAPTAIETCCTIAWMALSIDMLGLTADPRVADEVEHSFYNAALGAQHPSGRWCTYNTPMDGVREASAHTIVFQSRAGTPELNCCSVNGPRGLGMLSEWAIMAGNNRDLYVNYLGPGHFEGRLSDGTFTALECATDYPLGGEVEFRVTAPEATFRLLLRIPEWSTNTTVAVNDETVSPVTPGTYLAIQRRWRPEDRIRLKLNLSLRAMPGDREALGRASIYRGPLLLAYDQALNHFDERAIPALSLARLAQAKPAAILNAPSKTGLDPWLIMDLPAANGSFVRVCDFANAGAQGTRYVSWLPAQDPLPPQVVTRLPRDGAVIPTGAARFRWTGPRRTNAYVASYELQIGTNSTVTSPLLTFGGLASNDLLLEDESLRRLDPGRPYWWKVVARNRWGATDSIAPASSFMIDHRLPKAPRPIASETNGSPLISDSLAGKPERSPAVAEAAVFLKAVPGPDGTPDRAIETDGEKDRLIYSADPFPDEDYTVALWVQFQRLDSGRVTQICSAWCGPMDDPVRLCVEKGKLFGRIEAGQGYSTPGLDVQIGRWYHVALIKAGTTLSLVVDGQARGQATVPLYLETQARDLALAGNPHYAGPELLSGQFARFSFHARALGMEELAKLAQAR